MSCIILKFIRRFVRAYLHLQCKRTSLDEVSLMHAAGDSVPLLSASRQLREWCSPIHTSVDFQRTTWPYISQKIEFFTLKVSLMHIFISRENMVRAIVSRLNASSGVFVSWYVICSVFSWNEWLNQFWIVSRDPPAPSYFETCLSELGLPWYMWMICRPSTNCFPCLCTLFSKADQ
jgi:hypothetical protein